MNLYLMTKFSINLCFTVPFFYPKIKFQISFVHDNSFEVFLPAHFLFWEILLNLNLSLPQMSL